MMKKSIEEIQKEIVAFVNERDWKQFHYPKDVAISLSLEASELLECFQWKTTEEIESYLISNKSDIADELADVLYWVLLASHDFGIDIVEAVNQKMLKNAKKYPIEKARGSHKKYTEYEKE